MRGRPPRYDRSIPANFVNIPAILRDTPQWVAWRVHPRVDSKPAKVPVNPNDGEDASVTNPSCWGTFEQACTCFERDKNLAGIGFVFTNNDPFTGIDIDECRDEETGLLVDWAQIIVDTMESYVEVSPSGTGVKIIVKASSPGVEVRRNKIEMYSTARYFTITGNVLNWNQIEERQAKLDQMYELIFGVPAHAERRPKPRLAPDDEARKLSAVQAITDTELILLATNAANGGKFTRLWSGSLEDYGDDHSRADLALCVMLAYWTRADPIRIDKLFRESKLIRDKWDQRRGAMTYGQKTITEACAVAHALYDPEVGNVPTRNDLGNSDIFIRLNGDNFRFVTRWKEWLSWNGVAWQREADQELKHATEQVPSELMRNSLQLRQAGDEDAPRAYKWAIQAGEAHRLTSLDTVLRWRLRLEDTLLDQQPMKLAVGNGVVDLKDASVTEGQRADYLTRGTSVEYTAWAKCPLFDKFLEEIMENDKDMIAYLWRVMGYCLTGITTERIFFILHGEGRNGKTTFIEVLHALLDKYAQTARFQTFLSRKQAGGPNDDIAHLAGSRVVIASEADESETLDAAMVKSLTGSDTVRARFLYSGEFEFKPQFKLFLVTNHVPKVHDTAHAFWDRLHFIPFKYRVTEVDKTLSLKLMGELEGVLAKAVEGCLEWQRTGLQPPQKVLHAVEQLRDDMDPVADALRQLIVKSNNGHKDYLKHGKLYEVYQSWCRENGIRFPMSSKYLAKRLKTMGYNIEIVPGIGTGNAHVWVGMKLREGNDEHEL